MPRPSTDHLRLVAGTRSYLRDAQHAVQREFGLDRPPSQSALVVAGTRALLYLAADLRSRPYGDAAKLSVWTALVDGLDLPEQVDASLTEAEAVALLQPTREESTATSGQPHKPTRN